MFYVRRGIITTHQELGASNLVNTDLAGKLL